MKNKRAAQLHIRIFLTDVNIYINKDTAICILKYVYLL